MSPRTTMNVHTWKTLGQALPIINAAFDRIALALAVGLSMARQDPCRRQQAAACRFLATVVRSGVGKDLRGAVAAFSVVLFVFPLFVGLRPGIFTEAAFRMAQLRKDDAEVHMKKPWSERLVLSGLKPETSFLGSDHQRFDHVTVLLRSIGTKVVLELQAGAGKMKSVAFPADAVHVE